MPNTYALLGHPIVKAAKTLDLINVTLASKGMFSIVRVKRVNLAQLIVLSMIKEVEVLVIL